MAVADSVKSIPSDHLVQRIHSRDPSGKLYKGQGVTAANASIPSKYQTVVIDNSERRGFGRCAKRFDYELFADENPGPGTYVGHAAVNRHTDNPSYSKKGTGGFASKDRRIMKQRINSGPGAGTYRLPSQLFSKQDFNKSNTGNFATPIAVQRDKVEKKPAPNTYDVLKTNLGPKNNVSANAAFKSSTKREIIDTTEARSKPAPGQYNISDKLLHHSVKVPYSSFKSTSIRKMSQALTDNPGPGTYSPENAQPKTAIIKADFPRRHYLCISAPAMPLPPSLPGPGPGSYDIVDYQGQDQHYMSGSVFVSNTSRWTGRKVGDDELPGPAHYRPSVAANGRQSFIYNAAGRWI